MTENDKLTFQTDLGVSIDKNEDCPTCSICWNCDIKVKDCKYFNDVVEKLAEYEAIGTVEELKSMKENGAFTADELVQLACMQMYLKDYKSIGTVDDLRL